VNKDKGILDNWSIIAVAYHRDSDDPFTPPECQQGSRAAVQGQIRGDEEMIRKGLYVITSRPVKVESLNGDVRIYTQSGSVYCLGTPHPEYHRLYPDALERLVATLK
jgi:hypothetical protein